MKKIEHYASMGGEYLIDAIRRKKLFLVLTLLVGNISLIMAGAPLSGTYTIGGTSPDYMTINDAIADLMSEGVGGPVVFNIRDGVYEETFTIGEIAGSSIGNNVIFQSESGDNDDVMIQYKSNNNEPLWVLDTVSFLSFHDLAFRNDSTASYDLFEMYGNCTDVGFFNCHFESAAGDDDYALYLYPDTAWNLSVEGCTFDTLYLPIYIDGYYDSVYGISLKNNTFYYTDDYPIEVENGVDVEVIGNQMPGFFDDPIYLDECVNVTFKHNYGNWGDNGLVEMDYCSNVLIDSNAIDSSDYEAFYIYECNFITVTNNYVDYTYYSGVYVEYVDSGGYVVIENNTIDGYVDDYGIYVYDVEYCDVTVSNNTFNGWQDEYAIYIDADYGSVIVEDNVANDYIDYNGVYVYGYESDVTVNNNMFNGYVEDEAIYVDEAINLFIENNYIDSSNSYGIYVEDVQGTAVISGNTIHWSGDGGIYCSYTAGTTIEDNELNNVGDYGIELYRTDSAVFIRNNNITATEAAENLTGIYVWEAFPGSHPFEISGNKVLTYDEYEAIYVARVICDPMNRGIVANNVFTGFSYGWDSYQTHNLDVLHNSFTLFGSDVYSGIYLDEDTGITLKNNIFAYEGTDPTSEFLYVYQPDELVMDYNVYYIDGTNPFSNNDSLYADHLMNSGQDTNSLRVDPMFYNDTFDLHVCNAMDLYQAGATITAPVTDLDGTDRDLSMPTLGAYELEQADAAPLADFAVTMAGLDVTFDNTGLNYAAYSWDFGDGSAMSADENPVHSYTTPGTYVVTMVAENACGSSTKSDTIMVGNVGIEGLQETFSLQLFPNPTNGLFMVDMKGQSAQDMVLEVFNAQGKTILSAQYEHTDRLLRQVDLTGLAKGLYFVNIKYNDQSITRKIFMQ